MNCAIVVFPGSNCDRDMAGVTEKILRQPTRLVWHGETDLGDTDLVILPGGFSYGDYLRCGVLARFSPVLGAVVRHAQQGKWVLGVCNGFQILTEAGLLPGTLMRNRDLRFVCDQVPVRVERRDLPWTCQYNVNQELTLPIAHGEGCYYAEPEVIASLEQRGQVVFRYQGANPNGSVGDIAGICNPQGNVLGMMPHPERASDADLGGTDGLGLFQGLLAWYGKHACRN
ncbi:phosphoribosylformylglycinamidine synthase I [Gloeomargarita lithophora Alchichica-D10]|uniref:Phosphoribosylformylglycinamidine synthase subunit PurQ n=1 Tax=Gloeomargarita lithophora Alchichica-D10 TaxID=1188229 RepID=A0A1J0AAW7_9CYAN|nr:phosphoribosylformylglycinamidine synthase subunit PurQ [Gloeomargarita lithophora]APB33053.1 phosphoribosylformylglycinamidine synthase I [Gloeomargarita lithophora Alchichica-D10]